MLILSNLQNCVCLASGETKNIEEPMFLAIFFFNKWRFLSLSTLILFTRVNYYGNDWPNFSAIFVALFLGRFCCWVSVWPPLQRWWKCANYHSPVIPKIPHHFTCHHVNFHVPSYKPREYTLMLFSRYLNVTFLQFI